MGMIRIGRVSRPGGWRTLRLGVAALAAGGVLAAAPPTMATASPQAPDWTKQAPASSPPGLIDAAMDYDAATGTVVLFGGAPRPVTGHPPDADQTWAWDGTTWTKQAPAVHPSARAGASMAYDTATGTEVLFGGLHNSRLLNQTWTWNGTTWTLQTPAASPPARSGAAMAYDAATSTMVLFGGWSHDIALGDTWTWNGTTWTQQTPATSPPALYNTSMAYDAATGTVVLFGGTNDDGQYFADTWTWNGTTWTQQTPATSPPARAQAMMAYDAATGTVVLFGGDSSSSEPPILLADTWTWNGTTWMQQAPAVHPSKREAAAMAYDAATGTVVLFGGFTTTSHHDLYLRDTWTWG
jgi:hypothetical protein